jgi:Holliday junction resolvasome RuvABC DNA-binding subunit
MSQADVDTLYKISGRPPTARQMIVGYRRGARVDGIADSEDAYVAKSVRQSDIRPEYIALEHAANLSYPSAFVVRQITQAGGFTEQEASDVLYQSGWPRTYADKAANAFANPKTAAGQSHTQKAETQLWSTLHRSYVASETDDADAISTLQTLGLTPAEISEVIALWTLERDLTRKQLTPAQIKKAVSGKVTNRVTGQPWTRDDALSALIARGYSATDAATFLDL